MIVGVLSGAQPFVKMVKRITVNNLNIFMSVSDSSLRSHAYRYALVPVLAANVYAWAVVGVRCASLSPLQKRILKDNTFTLNRNPPLRMHFVVRRAVSGKLKFMCLSLL